MKAWWTIAVVMLMGAPTLAQNEGSEMDAQAEQQALGQLFALAQTQPAPQVDVAAEQPSDPAADQAEDTDDPPPAEPLRIVAQHPVQSDEDDLAVTEMNLSGSDVAVSVIGSDSLVITATDADLAILNALIKQLDEKMPSRELRMVILKEQPASDVAQKLEQAIGNLYPRAKDRPESQINITALASNILLIVAPQSRVDQIVALAKDIDEAFPILKNEIMVFQIKNRNATEAATKLEELITDLRKQQGADAATEFKITPNDANNTIMVIGPKSEEKTIRMFLDQIDAEAIPGYGELKLVVFPLLNADAKDLVAIFDDMLSAVEHREGVAEQIRRLIMLRRTPGQEPVELPPLNLEKTLRMVADEGTNSLLVVTVDENIEPVGEIIAMLDDVPLSVDMGMRIFPLQFADAETVADALEKMFEQGKELPRSAPGSESTKAVPLTPVGEAVVYNIDIVPDLRTNTIFVLGRPVQLGIVEKVIAQMDQPATAFKFPLRLLFLGEHIDATRVGSIIEDLVTKRVEALEAQNVGSSAIEREKVYLAVDIRSNALIISANEENYNEIEEITRKLDTAPDQLIDQIRIITCTTASAADLQSKIEDLWQRKAALRREGDVPEDLPVIVADQRSNSLVIASSPEDYAEIKRLIDKLESQPLAPIAEIRLLHLINNDASEISSMFESLFEERMQQRLASGQEENPSDRVALAFDAPTNTILVASSRDNYQEMLRLVEVLDAEPDIEGVVKTFLLENADANKVAETIQELFDEGLYNPSTGLDSSLTDARMQVAIVADVRANAILASASKPNMSIIGRLIKQMDDPDMPLAENIKLFPLVHADAVKITGMLDKLFEGMRSNAPDPDLFAEPTIIPDDRSNVLIISGSRDGLRRCEELIPKLDKPAGPPTSIFEVYPLQFASSVKLAPIMQEMFDRRAEGGTDERTPINLFADEGSNVLICSASRDDQIVMQGLLALLDKPSTIARQFAIFPLARAKAEPLAERMNQLFQSQMEGGPDVAAIAIAVEPDRRTNSLIVWASPTEMENIGTIINRLDTTEPAVEMGIRVIQLKQALAEDLATVLEESLIGDSGQAGDDSQAIIVSYSTLNEEGLPEQRKLLRQDITITPDERTNTLTVMAPAESMDMLEALIVDFDRIRPQVAEIRLFPLINADAEELVQRLQDLFEDQGDQQGAQTLVLGDGGGAAPGGGDTGVRQQLRFSADRRTNTIIAAGAEVDLNMVEKLIYQLDAEDSEERVFLVYEARNSTSEALTRAIADFAQSEDERLSELDDETSLMRRAERHVTAISDEDSNSVILGISPRYYDQYMDMIHQLDRSPPQVMIQVLIAEVSLSDSVELGIDFAGQDLLFTENAVQGPNGTVKGADFDFVLGTDVGAAGGTLGGFNFTVTGEDFSFLLRALESDARLEVLSRPTLLVENNQEANITIGEEVPIVQGSTFTDAGNTSTQIQYQDVGIILDVTPHINPDGYVNLEIRPEISSISDSSVQLTEGLSAPIFLTRSAETVVTLKDGETVVIGGLITDEIREAESKVPILGDIPGLGFLFRKTTNQTRKTELLIVLTVNIIRNEDDLRTMSIDQRDKSGLLENISHNPLMEGLRIRAEEDALAPTAPAGGQQRQPVRRRPDLYGPTPDVYGPPTPPPRRVNSSESGAPVASIYGPPIPGVARRHYGPGLPLGNTNDLATRRGYASARLVSAGPESP